MSQKTDKIFERAKLNLKKDNPENALRLFNQVLNQEPSHKQALRNKALIKVMNASREETEEFLLFAIDQQPEDDQLYQILGTFYHNKGEPQKALAQFKKSVELNENNHISHKGLGMIYAHFFNEHEKAVLHFSKAIAGDAESSELYFNRGCSHMILQNMDKAKLDLSKAGKLGNDKARKMVEKYFS